jgi:CBS domain containing-hemolysin-like protein
MQTGFILILVVCLATSMLLSGMEAGVFALSRLRIRQQMRKGNPRAKALYAYLEDPEHFLWTIMVGNTIANVLAVSIGFIGLYRWLGEWPWLFVLAMLVAGTLFYALCELLPKMVFRLYPNRLGLFFVTPFRMIDLVLKPLVAIMAFVSRSLLRWSGGKRFTGHLFGNREELRILMQQSAHGLTTEERTMINRVLDLQHLTVRQITIPMAKAVTIPIETRLQDFFALCRERGFSRMPVWKSEETRKRIAGLVSLKPLLYEEPVDVNKPVGDYLRPALYLNQETRLEVALRQMQRAGQRLAIVLDADRSELGVVSLQDILKAIFGEVSL